MLCRVQDDGGLVKVQLDKHPECGLFTQEFVGDDAVRVRYLAPEQPLVPPHRLPAAGLDVPLDPDTAGLERADVNLHRSMVSAFRMGAPYDGWFTACFGFETALMYIGDGRRPILGTFAPRDEPPVAMGGWLSSVSSYLYGQPRADPPWLVFSDLAPFLITTEQSLRNVSARLAEGDADMYKFRPSIVVDGEAEFDEDFWTELSVSGAPAFALTKLCNRCSSLNVDYSTGRPAVGERGAVLKKLMSDRRVDPGFKYAPCFGKYAFLARGCDGLALRVGDDVEVTKRSAERPVWDWPSRTKAEPRFYQYS